MTVAASTAHLQSGLQAVAYAQCPFPPEDVDATEPLEWAATCFLVPLALFLTGAGRYASVDHRVARVPPARAGRARRMDAGCAFPHTRAMNPNADEPDWDAPLTLHITPRALVNAVFWSASSAHTGTDSCIDPNLVLGEIRSVDDATGNWCRIVEQEFVEEGRDDVVWHDWSVEVRLGEVYVVGHWQVPVTAAPMEWEWHAQAAEEAFEKACVLFGARSRRTVAIVEPPSPEAPPADVKRH